MNTIQYHQNDLRTFSILASKTPELATETERQINIFNNFRLMMKSKCPFGEKPIPHLPIISEVDSKLSKLWFQSCVKFCQCSYIAQPLKVAT